VDGSRYWGSNITKPFSHPSGRLALRGVKLFADGKARLFIVTTFIIEHYSQRLGALGSWGAALFDDYSDKPGERGVMVLQAVMLKEWVSAFVADVRTFHSFFWILLTCFFQIAYFSGLASCKSLRLIILTPKYLRRLSVSRPFIVSVFASAFFCHLFLTDRFSSLGLGKQPYPLYSVKTFNRTASQNRTCSGPYIVRPCRSQ
jgi:hypothetical protein